MVSSHNGGLGIRDPVNTAKFAFESSQIGTLLLSAAIKSGVSLNIESHNQQMKNARNSLRDQHSDFEIAQIENSSRLLPESRQRTLRRIRDGDCSTWLSMICIPTQ